MNNRKTTTRNRQITSMNNRKTTTTTTNKQSNIMQNTPIYHLNGNQSKHISRQQVYKLRHENISTHIYIIDDCKDT